MKGGESERGDGGMGGREPTIVCVFVCLWVCVFVFVVHVLLHSCLHMFIFIISLYH